MRAFLLFLASLLLVQTAHAAESESVDTGKVVASLVSSHNVVAPGQDIHIALRTVLDPLWHTYWRNPGDSGEPVQIDLRIEGATIGDIVWPIPNPVATGPIVNYGFEGAPLFPIPVTLPDDIADTVQIEAAVYYLVCKDICIPESTTLGLTLPVGEPETDSRWAPLIDLAISESPVLGSVTGGVEGDETDLVFSFTDLPAGDFANAHLFPIDQGVIDHSAPQTLIRGPDGLEIATLAGYDWSPVGEDIRAVLAYDTPDGRAATQVAIQRGVRLPTGAATPVAPAPARASGLTLPIAVAFAFLGGLILNVMPCVFPIISLKALSLAKSAHGERVAARRDAFAYTAGVVAMFIGLAVLIIGLQGAGATVGWGFQLQSPKVTGALAVLLFAVGLNLLGVFEIGGRLQGAGQGLTGGSGPRPAFFTGLLAVIVATPCTAPFMAGAVGYALAQPAAVTLAVFLSLALGFAAPFLLLAYVPGLLARLPRPGPWMVRFRELLAFPMFATVIWLVWLVSGQAGETGVALVLLAMLALGFAIWLFQRPGGVAKLAGGLALLAAVLLPVSASTALTEPDLTNGAWSPARVAELRAEGRPVFVDFTADWCVTCKVNERLVLSKDAVKQAFTDTDTAFLVADWTNKNDAIAAELAAYGRAGVPLYLYFAHDSVTAQVLPQVLTQGNVIQTLVEGQNQERN